MTFWPRANHPLTPPSYAERALGDLNDRIGVLSETPDDHVVIAGHSQGSVLAFTVILQKVENLLIDIRGLRPSVVTGRSP